MWTVGTKRKPDHMKSEQGDVREICPKTGEQIDPVELPKSFIVKRFLMDQRSLPHPLDKYKAMGVKNMTEKQIEAAYKIIKGIVKSRIL
jgi:hypothetical protein